MGNYQELEAWQKSRLLATHIYRKTTRFPQSELYGLVQQMRRAAVSIASNLAEGHGRKSSRDRTKFFGIALGSIFELETQTLIAGDLGFLSERQAQIIVEACNEVARKTYGLIRHYREGTRQ